MGVVARSDRDKYSGWPPPKAVQNQDPQPEEKQPRKRRKAEKVNDDDGA